MRKIGTVAVFVAILALAVFFRFYKITDLSPGLYPDEAMNGNNALEAIASNDYKIFYPENNGREGLFINIQSQFLKIFLSSEGGEPKPWMLRIPSAIFGVLTVIGVFFLTRKIFERNGMALFASFLTASSFWHINFSRIGFRAIMAPFFLVWALFLLLFAFKSEKKSVIAIAAILGGLIYGLGFHSYIAYRATPLLILIFFIAYLFKNKEKNKRKKILLASVLFTLATIAAVFPLLIYFAENPADFFGRTNQISVFASATPLKDLTINILKTAAMFNFSGDYNWRHNIAGQPLLFWPTGIMFLVGLFFSVKNFKKNFLLLFWLLVAALPVVISNESLPHALRAIIMAPPVFIIAALGGLKIYDAAKQKLRFTNLAVLVFLIILTAEAYYSYFHAWGENPEVKNAFSQNYVEVGEKLNSLPKETPKYVIVESGGVDVRGLPMPAQTVMFLTDTFRPEKMDEKNLHYVLPFRVESLPEAAFIIKI